MVLSCVLFTCCRCHQWSVLFGTSSTRRQYAVSFAIWRCTHAHTCNVDTRSESYSHILCRLLLQLSRALCHRCRMRTRIVDGRILSRSWPHCTCTRLQSISTHYLHKWAIRPTRIRVLGQQKGILYVSTFADNGCLTFSGMGRNILYRKCPSRLGPI